MDDTKIIYVACKFSTEEGVDPLLASEDLDLVLSKLESLMDNDPNHQYDCYGIQLL